MLHYLILYRYCNTYGLIFILASLASRWKQIIGYFFFTKDDFDGAILKPIILQILHKAESIHLHVNNIMSDIEPFNIAFWLKIGITANIHKQSTNKI